MLLEAEGLWSGYGPVNILEGTGLVVGAGEIVAVLGRNGVGKTTLMRALSGALACKRGSLTFNGVDVTTSQAHERARAGIAYVPQGRQIFSQLTVRENILIGAYAQQLDDATIHKRLDGLMEDFPALRLKLRDLGGSLSGGQQQLLALARALITAPRVLLLDEPSEGIQPSVLDDICSVLKRVVARDQVSLLLVEQNLDFARRLATRGYVMDGGRIHREIQIEDGLDVDLLSQELFGAVA